MGYLLIGHAEVSTDMSSTTLDNPAMYDVWCCQRWWILAASASSPVGNLRQVRKKQTTDAVFLFLFGSQVMLNQDELNIAGHPLWIWSVVWLEHSFQIFCFVRSFLGAFVPCHRWKTLVAPLSAGNHLRESLLSAFANCMVFEPLELPFAVWCQGDTSAAGVRHK